MGRRWLAAGTLVLAGLGCARSAPRNEPGSDVAGPAPTAAAQAETPRAGQVRAGEWIGFDRNDYPGDQAMAMLHKMFAFTGYWLTNPPGEMTNSWVGKRNTLREQGWGFLLLANGRLDKQILRAQKAGTSPAALGRNDAAVSVKAAQQEGFPAGSVLFLDQEEGGRLLDEQAAYLLAWTEAVAGAGFRPGVYASGQIVEDAPGQTIDTVQDVRARVKAQHLHEVAVFDALDQCPPAPGCTVHAKPLSSPPDGGLVVWQYAQSPRRPEITKSCGVTYAADGNCYAPGFPKLFLDMSVASEADPSHGR